MVTRVAVAGGKTLRVKWTYSLKPRPGVSADGERHSEREGQVGRVPRRLILLEVAAAKMTYFEQTPGDDVHKREEGLGT